MGGNRTDFLGPHTHQGKNATLGKLRGILWRLLIILKEKIGHNQKSIEKNSQVQWVVRESVNKLSVQKLFQRDQKRSYIESHQ